MKKPIIKYLLIIFVVFLIVREFTPFRISIYKSFSNSRTSADSEINSKSYETKNITDNIQFINDDLQYINLDKNDAYNVEFNYKKENNDYNKTNKNIIVVNISTDNHISKLRYIPLIKPITFSSKNSYLWDAEIYNKGKVINVEGSGNVNIKGNKNIYGICSGKESKEVIDKIIIENVQKQIEKDIKTKLVSLKTS